MRKDLTLREKVVVAPLIALLLLLGFYPKPVTRRDQPGRPGDHARHRQAPTRRRPCGTVQEAGK